ncbi:hypothetical protein Egran_05313 [Elaphomyces granulatus]|uniref:Uncharacterized protein n=1 Tax=Elaphomyces granulatus TaxID=519963 RepID=A0A232LRX9_9EURO|nr:hypothetical protein Egran_05313 [Elaphomyces granulatus]
MSYAYPHGGTAAPQSFSHRKHFVEPPNSPERLTRKLLVTTRRWLAELHTNIRSSMSCLRCRGRRERRDLWREAWWSFRRGANFANAIILMWAFVLWWGERTVFESAVSTCLWETWEKWPQNAIPHHVVFVADPQLVDPHTYPDRPWPLSSLTVLYTDKYLRRAYITLQKRLLPDTTFFLGDLFDGGREWATSTSSSPEERYRRYDDKFWLKEYARFSRIFVDTWNNGGTQSSSNPRGRKLIASLPGNHDLGFGTGIQEAVRMRFYAYFGRGNRVDVIGNHTFVSVDTVSLSAMDQSDPNTGSSGTGAGDGSKPNGNIWTPTMDFLDGVHAQKARLETEELHILRNQSEGTVFRSGVFPPAESAIHKKNKIEAPGFPTILLTHVPLYRKPATPCGPLRERYPPSSTDPLPEEDDRNSIKIQGGYQYQNVLTPAISKELVSKIGPELIHVYSGDDHDYCEVTHHEYSSSPKEITVKSLSWAMGMRRPGFLLTSLWNPLDVDTGKPIGEIKSSPTIQNHLCLLPDQLSIFIKYAYSLVLTILLLLARSIFLVFFTRAKVSSESEEELPYVEHRLYDQVYSKSASSSMSSSSSSASSETRVASRGSFYQQEAFRQTKSIQIITEPDDDNMWMTQNGNQRPYLVIDNVAFVLAALLV